MNQPTLDTLTQRLDRLERVKLRVKMFGRGLTSCVALSLLVGCASVTGNWADEVARTWQGARVYLPETWGFSKPATAPAPDHPVPTVLYLHGCTGIISHDSIWSVSLSSAGYAVVMPDSFAREYRRENCDLSTHTFGHFLQAREMRQEEIEYALSRLRNSPWVDQRNVFLMGHSEGGLAVARWRGGRFNGQIISGWTCTSGNPSLDGVLAPRSVPVLAIAFERDPWYRGANVGSCESKFGWRKDARQVTLPGSGHGTANSAAAQDAVLQFLRDYTVR